VSFHKTLEINFASDHKGSRLLENGFQPKAESGLRAEGISVNENADGNDVFPGKLGERIYETK
jgi:hypothetical protein